MNNPDKNPEQMATDILKVMLGMFPTMASMPKDSAILYSNEMAKAIASNNSIDMDSIDAGLKHLRSGEYKSKYAPSIPEFISMCRANVNRARYLPQATRIKRTDQEIKEQREKGFKALANIKDMMKND